MAKLFPPQIERSLPAFTGRKMKIPFSLGSFISEHDFSKVSLIMKNAQENITKEEELYSSSFKYDLQKKQYEALFELGFEPIIGQSYKVQIALVDNEGVIGSYSNFGTIKYTSIPKIEIKNLKKNPELNCNASKFIGYYNQKNGDITEKVLSYRFELYDETMTLIKRTEDLVHNNSLNGNAYESFDEWNLDITLIENKIYNLRYLVKTINGLELTSPWYKIVNSNSIDINMNAIFLGEMNNEDGYVKLSLRLKDSNCKDPVTGKFIIWRFCEEEGEVQIHNFELYKQIPQGTLWKDFTITQGRKYKYSLQAYNEKGIYSNKMAMTPNQFLEADFEDIFLFDGKKQLKIKFNPKVGSFKDNLLESKVNTLGGRYPYIFRNGKTKYKEFPVSGLISLLTDSNKLFLKNIAFMNMDKREKTKSLSKKDFNQSHDLTAVNFKNEREFKLQVLEWLNNGYPKLFRSPAEGNYIVKLSNISLSPNETLGRMLHSFSATAYEIAGNKISDLNNFNFITNNMISKAHKELKIESRNLTELLKNSNIYVFPKDIYFAHFDYQKTDLVVALEFENAQTVNINIKTYTGRYNVEISEKNPLKKITIISGNLSDDAVITYGYWGEEVIIDSIIPIESMKIENRIEQYIGTGEGVNIISEIESETTNINRVYQLNIVPRMVYEIYSDGENYYKDKEKTLLVDEWDRSGLYFDEINKIWLDGGKKEIKSPTYKVKLNNQEDFSDFARNTTSEQEVDVYTAKYLGTSGSLGLDNIGEVKILEIGTGLMANIVYQAKVF